MDETMIVIMLLCIGLAAIGLKMRMWPVTFISSIGWVIVAMRYFQETTDWLALALMLAVAISQVIMVRDAGQ